MIHCNVKLCVGCKSCEVSCSNYHFGSVSPALTRIRVAKLEEIGIDMAVTCLGCIEHPCIEECNSQALSIDPKGVIRLDNSMCSLCDLCVNACPIGAVGFNESEPLFCNLCEGETTCVKNCPTGALSYLEADSTSLKEFLKVEGQPSQKRAHFVKEMSKALREEWINGGRIDS